MFYNNSRVFFTQKKNNSRVFGRQRKRYNQINNTGIYEYIILFVYTDCRENK